MPDYDEDLRSLATDLRTAADVELKVPYSREAIRCLLQEAADRIACDKKECQQCFACREHLAYSMGDRLAEAQVERSKLEDQLKRTLKAQTDSLADRTEEKEFYQLCAENLFKQLRKAEARVAELERHFCPGDPYQET